MKKFLSLVLAMIMAMSLVTISAGAIEYEELADKDEITYEEAVAVLNKIGIIEGYPDGSYKPEGLLTRQVAAKFVVSLLIGPEAADNLAVAVAPYPDVPTSSQFAGYISYCKTANIISGYSDGTFRPEGSLTGYAFAKMLLGAIGYRSDIEGFTGSGWTMNVARLGNAANLFDRLQFAGGEALNREEAAQLCLNTLKATMVEYSGGFNVTAGDATVTGAMTRSYVTSNQDFARNINNRKVSDTSSSTDTPFTVEFGEEHFKDLNLVNDGTARDSFGRPSNRWSWKKVTIGTFPIEPDFVYVEQVAAGHDPKVTDASKIRALGLNGYFVNSKTAVNWNGYEDHPFSSVAGIDSELADIADFTDNGTVVEVYVSEDIADWISDVVVVQTQLMQIKKVGAENVTLKLYKDDGADGHNKEIVGFNQIPIDVRVEDVEVTDDCFDFLSGLAVDDVVAIVPLTEDNETFTVAAAYEPETVTGALTGSSTFAVGSKDDDQRTVIAVTVGGTEYKVADWNCNLYDANRDTLKVTKGDVKLYLDEFGNAMLATGIGSNSDYMILGSWKAAVVDGTIVRIAEGWDIKGNAISLNVGSEKSGVVTDRYDGYYDVNRPGDGFKPGDLLRYTNEGVSGVAEWTLSKAGVFEVPGNVPANGNLEEYSIKASNSAVTMDPDQWKAGSVAGIASDNRPVVGSSIKTIYVTFDSKSGDVDYIEVKDGLQNISYRELQSDKDHHKDRAEACVGNLSNGDATGNSTVSAVVIKRSSNDASLKNLGYVYDTKTSNKKDETGAVATNYKVFTVDEEENWMESTSNGIGQRRFVRFDALENDLYRMRVYDQVLTGTSTMTATLTGVVSSKNDYLYYIDKDSYKHVSSGKTRDENPNTKPNDEDTYPWIHSSSVGGTIDNVDLTNGDKYEDLISVKGAKFLDLVRKPNLSVSSAKDLADLVKLGYDVTVDVAFNDNPDSDDFRLAYMVVITDVNESGTTPTGGNGAVVFSNGSSTSSVMGSISNDTIKPYGNGTAFASFTLTAPDYVKFDQLFDGVNDDDRVEVQWQLIIDGKEQAPVSSFTTLTSLPSTGTPVSSTDAGQLVADVAAADATAAHKLNSFTVTNFRIADGSTYSIEGADSYEMRITAVRWGEVERNFVDVSNTGVGTFVSDTVLTRITGVGTAPYTANVTGKYDDGDITYEIEGSASSTPATPAGTGDVTTTLLTTTLTTDDSWLAAGTSGITVNVTGLKPATTPTHDLDSYGVGGRYLINTSAATALLVTDLSDDTKLGTSGLGTDRIWLGVTDVSTSGSVSGTGTWTGAQEGWINLALNITDASGIVDHYTVTIKMPDGTTWNTDVTPGTARTRDLKVTKDMMIDKDDITITATYKAYVKTVKWDGANKDLTLIFTEALEDVGPDILGSVFTLSTTSNGGSCDAAIVGARFGTTKDTVIIRLSGTTWDVSEEITVKLTGDLDAASGVGVSGVYEAKLETDLAADFTDAHVTCTRDYS